MDKSVRTIPYLRLLHRAVAAGLIAAGLSGCSTLTPNECLYTDWYAKGVADAAAGLPVTQILEYNRDCNLHGINPDRWDFVLGWEGGERPNAS